MVVAEHEHFIDSAQKTALSILGLRGGLAALQFVLRQASAGRPELAEMSSARRFEWQFPYAPKRGADSRLRRGGGGSIRRAAFGMRPPYSREGNRAGSAYRRTDGEAAESQPHSAYTRGK